VSNTGTFLTIACRSTLAVAFAVALYGKAYRRAAFRSFAASLGELGLVSRPLRSPVAGLTVLAEAVALVLLAFDTTAILGLLISAAVMAAFSAGLGTSVARGRRRPCHCFGASSIPLSWLHVGRNLVLLGVAILGVAAGPARSIDAAAAALTVLVGAATAALIIRVDDLVDLFQPASR
jgi:hypothetical protein